MQDKKEAGIFELTLRSIRLPAAVAYRSTRMPVEKDFPLFECKRSKAAKKWPEATFFVIRASALSAGPCVQWAAKKTAKGQPPIGFFRSAAQAVRARIQVQGMCSVPAIPKERL